MTKIFLPGYEATPVVLSKGSSVDINILVDPEKEVTNINITRVTGSVTAVLWQATCHNRMLPIKLSVMDKE